MHFLPENRKCAPPFATKQRPPIWKILDPPLHIVAKLTGRKNINYLDDFFFAAYLAALCNQQIDKFLQVCGEINFPVSYDKTVWSTTLIPFLGLLIDTLNQRILIPIDKIVRALQMINYFLTKKSKKITLEQLQRLCGFLNFLCKCIIPGRAFTRRMYTFGAHLTRPNHHLRVKPELRADLEAWKSFLSHQAVFSRPFIDLDNNMSNIELDWFTDTTSNPELGMGGVCGPNWFISQWDSRFVRINKPSINYLELFALACAVYMWLPLFQNQSIIIFCDNESVVYMINSSSSKCKNCMVLIRLIVLKCLLHNVRLTAAHVQGVLNKSADLLSRLKYKEFKRYSKQQGKNFNNHPDELPPELWPMSNVWVKEKMVKKQDKVRTENSRHKSSSIACLS